MLGVFAEFETNLRSERQAEGVAAAQKRGVHRGRPPKIDMDAIRRRLAEGQSSTSIARDMRISRGTVYKAKDMADAHDEQAADMQAGFGSFLPKETSQHLRPVPREFFQMSIYTASIRLGQQGDRSGVLGLQQISEMS